LKTQRGVGIARDALHATVVSPVTGFVHGATALIRGVNFLARTPSVWPLALVPVTTCLLLWGLIIYSSVHYIPVALHTLWPGMDAWIGSWGAGSVRVLGSLIASLLGLFVAMFLTPMLCAPAFDRLVLRRERALGVPPRRASGFGRELYCAVLSQVIAVCVFSPVLVCLTLITWLVPPLAVVMLPLKFIVLATTFAWSLLDYPLSLRGASPTQRFRLMWGQASRVLGFGASLAVVFAVPLFPFLLLPVAVVAAADVVAELERSGAQ